MAGCTSSDGDNVPRTTHQHHGKSTDTSKMSRLINKPRMNKPPFQRTRRVGGTGNGGWHRQKVGGTRWR